MNFKDFPFSEALQDALLCMGFEEATPIQEKAIPEIIAENDIIACAQTGTGKTAAFVLPILHKILSNPRVEGVNTLVLCPTRELAIQIEREIEAFSYFTGISSIAIYGGSGNDNWGNEKNSLSKGADIVVATPGRLMAHMNMGYVNFSNLQNLVLDEADRMLDIGFYDDIVSIIKALPENRQSLMFSATMPVKIEQLAKKILQNPIKIEIARSKVAEGVLQAAYLVYDYQKIALLNSLLQGKEEDYESIIIFCSTKKQVNELVGMMKKNGMTSRGISSNLEQYESEEVLLQFKARKIRILVATDVISRGIDIKNIDLVINFNVPKDAEDYVHRVGRTARAKSTGVALTLVNDKEMGYYQRIEKFMGKEVVKLSPPPELGEAPLWSVKPPRNDKYKKRRNYNRKK